MCCAVYRYICPPLNLFGIASIICECTYLRGVNDFKGTKVKVSRPMIQRGKRVRLEKKYRNRIAYVNLINDTGEKEVYTI